MFGFKRKKKPEVFPLERKQIIENKNPAQADTIVIHREIKKEDLRCIVCYDYLNGEIYQCTNGPHYTCNNCTTKIFKCPTCNKTDKFVRAIYLEQDLKKYKSLCQYQANGCNEKIFSWDSTHSENCKFKPTKCFICNKQKTCLTNKDFCTHLTSGECLYKFSMKAFDNKKIQYYYNPIIITDKNIILIIFPANKEISIILALSLNTDEFGLKIELKSKQQKIDFQLTIPVITKLDEIINDSKAIINSNMINNMEMKYVETIKRNFDDENVALFAPNDFPATFQESQDPIFYESGLYDDGNYGEIIAFGELSRERYDPIAQSTVYSSAHYPNNRSNRNRHSGPSRV